MDWKKVEQSLHEQAKFYTYRANDDIAIKEICERWTRCADFASIMEVAIRAGLEK